MMHGVNYINTFDSELAFSVRPFPLTDYTNKAICIECQR